MTTKVPSRHETESEIYSLLKRLREVYYSYNPDGDYIHIFVNHDQIICENDFSYSGKDHEKPICVRMYDK